jgi:hypothetical protein
VPARFALLAALFLAIVLSLGAAGGVGAASRDNVVGARNLAEQAHALAGARHEAGLKSVAVRRAAQIEDDDDDLDCKPDAMGHGPHAALPPRAAVLTPATRVACRLALARSAAFRARQRLDDAFPTGPPSIPRESRPS